MCRGILVEQKQTSSVAESAESEVAAPSTDQSRHGQTHQTDTAAGLYGMPKYSYPDSIYDKVKTD